jgi:hypothetical protein
LTGRTITPTPPLAGTLQLTGWSIKPDFAAR